MSTTTTQAPEPTPYDPYLLWMAQSLGDYANSLPKGAGEATVQRATADINQIKELFAQKDEKIQDLVNQLKEAQAEKEPAKPDDSESSDESQGDPEET